MKRIANNPGLANKFWEAVRRADASVTEAGITALQIGCSLLSAHGFTKQFFLEAAEMCWDDAASISKKDEYKVN